MRTVPSAGGNQTFLTWLEAPGPTSPTGKQFCCRGIAEEPSLPLPAPTGGGSGAERLGSIKLHAFSALHGGPGVRSVEAGRAQRKALWKAGGGGALGGTANTSHPLSPVTYGFGRIFFS